MQALVQLTLETSTQKQVGKRFLLLFTYYKQLTCAEAVLIPFDIFSLSVFYYGAIFMLCGHQEYVNILF